MTFQLECFADFVKDATALFPEHWEELALNKDKIKLSLDLSKYEKAEKDGILHLVTARDGKKLVGYYTAAILPHLHYADAGPMASTDMYFLRKPYRLANVGAKFLSFIEGTLRERGVTKIYISCKAHHDLRPLFESLGFGLSDYMFTKLLD